MRRSYSAWKASLIGSVEEEEPLPEPDFLEEFVFPIDKELIELAMGELTMEFHIVTSLTDRQRGR